MVGKLTAYYRPTRAEISLDALNRNIQAFRAAIPVGTRLMATVKADAYGHGAVQMALEAEACGVDYLGVAFLDEAVQLRRSGVTAPILVLGYVPEHGLTLARELDITIALFREDTITAAEALPVSDKKLRVHIKIDSGMGRLGMLPGEEALTFIKRACRSPQLDVEGLFTHYASADELDKSYMQSQYTRFTAFVEEVRLSGCEIPIVHAGNSATGIDVPEQALGMLRLGISMYGLYPSTEVNKQRITLEPVLALKTEVVMVKHAPAGWGISYGSRYVTAGEERIGTLPVGYADGYSRMLTGKVEALIRGKRVPVLGTICMDQCMIALDPVETEDLPVETGEEVVLIGAQGETVITADEIASKLGTINYEVTCMIASRVPRVYRRDGQVVAVANALA